MISPHPSSHSATVPAPVTHTHRHGVGGRARARDGVQPGAARADGEHASGHALGTRLDHHEKVGEAAGERKERKLNACAHAFAPSLTLLTARPLSAQTLADTTGGVASVGEGAVGLIGNVPVTFTQGNESISTKAIVGQPLSEVASQCGQYIKYQCRKGECGTCEVRINGQWTRTCVTKVPHVAQGETFAVHVRGSMVKTAKSSRFYSFKSILAGAKNNLLGMVGFVREGKRSDATFKHRIDSEKELLEKVKARKAARLAEQQKQ